MKKLFFLILIVALSTGCSAKYHTAYPLHGAIYNADISKIKELLQSRTFNDVRDDAGLLPIHVAALAIAGYGVPNNDVIKLLIESGADPNAKSATGETALDIALSYARGDVVDDLIRAGVKLWTPEAGKARLFFVGIQLWDYAAVTVGKQSKNMNQNRVAGVAFIDVDTGKHAISVSGEPTSSIDAIAGQTYYFEVTQDMKRRSVQYLILVKIPSFGIITLTEVEAKQKIKEILKSKELSEEKKSNTSVTAEITKPILPKPTDAEVNKNSDDSSEYAQKLRELKKLKEEGLLTDKEYEQKRKAIVDGM
jgi:hypothetical protein